MRVMDQRATYDINEESRLVSYVTRSFSERRKIKHGLNGT